MPNTAKKTTGKKVPLFVCNECNKPFYTVKAAEKASWNGCPNCNGGDIGEWPSPYFPVRDK
jgi:hypothetical protein